jgi:hypothetical protein
LTFSVGETAGALVAPLLSAGFSSLAHAVRAPEPRMAAAPATNATWRITRVVNMLNPHFLFTVNDYSLAELLLS